MALELVIPASIEAAIQGFDGYDVPLSYGEVESALGQARQALKDPSEAENLGAYAEVLAFTLSRNREGSVWNTYFGPRGSGQNSQGETVYFPDVRDAPPEVIHHWAGRATNLKHPLLIARYSDLVWDLAGLVGKMRRDPDCARRAVDGYIASLPLSAAHDKMKSAVRALDLALQLKDKPRTAVSKAAVMDLFRAAMVGPEGMWWVPFDRLINEQHAGVTEAEQAELIAGVEGLVGKHSSADRGSFDPHRCRDEVQRLLPIYRKQKKYGDVKRLYQIVARVFEQAAGLADTMLAAAFLKTSMENFEAAHMKEDAQRVRILMQDAINKSHADLKSISHEVVIPKDDMDNFLDAVVVEDLGDSFANIAVQFMLKRGDLEQRVKDLETTAPLYSMISHEILAEDRVVATVGSTKDDPFGRLFEQAKMDFAYSNPWLMNTYNRLFEKHEVRPEHLAAWANRHKVYDDMGLLIQGLHAWFQGDVVKSVHLLVPQVERGLRKIAQCIGMPVTKALSGVKGASVAINIGDILFAPPILGALGQNMVFHLQALYCDPRGLNLRNELAHGLMDSGDFHEYTGNLVVQSLLMLGLWKELGDLDRDGASPEPEAA